MARLDNLLDSQKVGGVGSSRSPASDRGVSRSSSTAAGEEADESTRVEPVNGVSLDPFELGLLSIETGNMLLDRFRTSLTPYFPFVIIPESVDATDLNREKPIVCLAILFASSHENGPLQARLSQLFEQMLATVLLQGAITSLKNLQGLLVYTAWMQYQPHPRKHTQHIFLAMSIIFDLELHKPKELPTRTNEDDNLGASTGGLGTDELRALVGLYSVASSASVILDKFNCFPTIPSLAEDCAAVAQRAEYPTDRYLPQIVDLLRMIEDVYDLAKNTTSHQRGEVAITQIRHLQQQWQSLKESLPPHAESIPFLNIQAHAAELLFREIALPGSSVVSSPDPAASLAETIPAVKSLLGILLSSEPGQDLFFVNPAWITLGYGLSLGVKLDILCTTCGISPETATELRQSLDIAGTLKGLIERMRMSINHSTNTKMEGPHPLCQFFSRAEEVERWYARHGPPALSGSATARNQHSTEMFTGQVNGQQHPLSSYPRPIVEVDAFLGPTISQDLGLAFDPDMFALEGLDFEGMDFAVDPQEAWNPFVFPNGTY